MNIKKCMKNFSKYLEKRTALLTEDTIRMYLYLSMIEQDSDCNKYILELPYSDNKLGKISGLKPSSIKGSKQELDLFYNGKDKIACEVKFHRESNGKSSNGRTKKAGELFNDLNRLNLIDNSEIKKHLIYVTDEGMEKYLTDSNGGDYRKELSDLFDENGTNKGISIFDKNTNLPKTFLDNAWKSFESNNKQQWKNPNLKLEIVFYDSITCVIETSKKEFYIRAIEVK